MYDLVLQTRRIADSGVPNLLAMGEQARLAGLQQFIFWLAVTLVVGILLLVLLRWSLRNKVDEGLFLGIMGLCITIVALLAISSGIIARVAQPDYYNVQYTLQVLGTLR
jgi:hypothetical protein